ncbi:MAG TPA: ribonucleoside-diphosphate reductase subunit alpha [Verrucomicrobiales bacterium]|nr:ribonucleoside-diphosphate reductase subunit alpha [Verrucomicrobiales bacterium]
MIGKNHIEEDIQLKAFVRSRPESKPRYNWADESVLPQPAPRIPVLDHGEQKSFTAGDIATIIGEALTDLMLSRQENEIFTDKNRRLVSQIAQMVSGELAVKSRGNGEDERSPVSAGEVTRIIERALIRNNAYDLARSIVTRYQPDGSSNEESDMFQLNSSSPMTCRVIRRNGQVVNWNRNKVEIAIRKAFLSQQMDSAPAVDIATTVTQRIQQEGIQMIGIEELQDLVQEEMMRSGHYKVAAAYVIYRAHRADVRAKSEEEVRLQAIDRQESMILVKRDDGETFLWDGLDLRKRVEFARMGLDLCLTGEHIETELRRSLFPEMTLEDLNRTIILNAKALIERDADFAKFSARILLTFIYEEVLDWNIVTDGLPALGEFHRRTFKRNLQRGVEIDRISPKLIDFELDKLAAALDPTADFEFDFLGIQTLYDRYLLVDKTQKKHRRLETPQLFWMRVAMGLFVGEKSAARTEHIIGLYQLYKSRRFCSSTPTLFNSGTHHSQLSSCYLYKVDDSIESIMLRGIAENAFLSKWAGGLGGSWTSVRGTGGYIKGTNGESQGVIPFLKLHNDQLIAVNQGGKRRGSGCAYLETWHNDIEDFLLLRVNTGDERRRTHDMNTANWIPDLFMKRMESRQNWTLFRANETPDLHDLYGRAFELRYAHYEEMARRGEIFGKEVAAIELWKQMLKALFETGHPWITFKDPCNVRSPQDHCGVIHSSNLCTEITLNTSAEETAVCNLGSIILENHLDAKGNIDHEKLRNTVRVAVRALDNVIDINFYPTEAAKTANTRHRPIGLGVMGLANCLYQKNVPFASEAAVEFNDEIMEAVAYYAYEASSDLAVERGRYSSFQGSKWSRGLLPPDTVDLLERERGLPIDVPRNHRMDWAPLRAKIESQGMRNSNVLAIAPTATISNIMGSTPCIEPMFKNLFAKSNLSGDFTMLNPFLVRDLKARGLWNQDMLDRLKYYDGELSELDEIPADLKEKYLTAFGIDHKWLIAAAARRQKWIDQSQSVNLFLASPDLKVLSHMYRAAWRSGLKTTYYLRTTGASNIEKATVNVKKKVRIVGDEPQASTEEYTEEEKQACSLEARRLGIECEACQ